MPVYDWECTTCRRRVEVVHSVIDYMTPPDLQCHGEWRKLVMPTMIHRSEAHNSCFPAKVKIDGKEITLLSRAHQDAWMKENDYVRVQDVADDSTWNDSQHSHFDQRDPPPTPEAEDLLKECHWVDAPPVETANV